MNNEIWCNSHRITPDAEKWKVSMEELTNVDDEACEPFIGQVCPACYLRLRDRVRDLKRDLKVESREAIALRAENDHLQKVVDAVVESVKGLTGKDAKELAEQKYPPSMSLRDQSMLRNGELTNILPNLITEAIKSGHR
jgi:hypothetical protein